MKIEIKKYKHVANVQHKALNPESLVLVIDGQIAPNQVETKYISTPGEISEFVVVFAVHSDMVISE
jgi:hypothetical protein